MIGRIESDLKNREMASGSACPARAGTDLPVVTRISIGEAG